MYTINPYVGYIFLYLLTQGNLEFKIQYINKVNNKVGL
jgi:hypothetical protein